MKTKEILISWRENGNINGEIILRREGGDTFIGELANTILHHFNRMKVDTFAKRFYYFNAYVLPVLSKNSGVTFLHAK